MEVLRAYLEIQDPGELLAGVPPAVASRTERMEACTASFARWLYVEVGRPYAWVDRLAWTDEEHRSRLADPEVSVWLFMVGAAPAGYFELQSDAEGSVEICYFGLLPEFMGQGLGRKLLSDAVTAAFGLGARRVWLHTCSLDDPKALPNYLARGFRAFKSETYTIEASHLDG